MNKTGHKATLKASQPGNANAAKSGVYSERVREDRARRLAGELEERFGTSAMVRAAAASLAGVWALTEAADADLAERGITDKSGDLRSVATLRSRLPKQFAAAIDVLYEVNRRERIYEQTEYARRRARKRTEEPPPDTRGPEPLRRALHDYIEAGGDIGKLLSDDLIDAFAADINDRNGRERRSQANRPQRSRKDAARKSGDRKDAAHGSGVGGAGLDRHGPSDESRPGIEADEAQNLARDAAPIQRDEPDHGSGGTPPTSLARGGRKDHAETCPEPSRVEEDDPGQPSLDHRGRVGKEPYHGWPD